MADTEPIDTYLGNTALILFFAPSVQSPAYERQMEVLHHEDSDWSEQKIVLGYVFLEGKGKIGEQVLTEEDAAGLRQRFGIDGERFTVLIFNQDGTEIRRDDAPLQPVVLFEKTLAREPDYQEK